MAEKKKKHIDEKPEDEGFAIDMGFEQALERFSRVKPEGLRKNAPDDDENTSPSADSHDES